MEDKNFKQQKAKFNFVIIYILGFVISAFFEFYWISYYPYDYRHRNNFMHFGVSFY